MFLPFLVQGSAYWMEIKGNKKINEKVNIQLIYGNIDENGVRHRQSGKELNLAGEFKFSLITPNGKKEILQLVKKENCWETDFTPSQQGLYRILGLNNTHPVVDRSAIGGENILPVDYLCGAYLIGDQKDKYLKPQQFLDINLLKEGNKILFTAFRNGESEKAGTKIRIFNPENWEKELTLSDKGEASFNVNQLKGMYNIRLDWVDKRSGNYQGTSYTSIRHRCNYCLFID